MPGAKIPVLEIEKLWLKKSGRGLYAHGDDVVVNEDKLSKGFWVSGMRGQGGTATRPPSANVLAGASSMGWLKVTWMSGSAGATATGYLPIFSGNLITV